MGGPTDYFVTLNLSWGWVEAVTIILCTIFYTLNIYFDFIMIVLPNWSEIADLKNLIFPILKTDIGEKSILRENYVNKNIFLTQYT